MDQTVKDLLTAFEMHDVDRIAAILDAGFDPHTKVQGKSLVNILIEKYFRSDRFTSCLEILLARGARLDDPKITSVLLNLETAIDRFKVKASL